MAIRKIIIEVDDSMVLAMHEASGGVEELTGLNDYIMPAEFRQEPLNIGSSDTEGNSVYPKTYAEWLAYSGIKILSDEVIV